MYNSHKFVKKREGYLHSKENNYIIIKYILNLPCDTYADADCLLYFVI